MAKKNNNLNPQTLIPALSDYECALDLQMYAVNASALWDNTFSLLSEEVEALGGKITPCEEEGELFLILSGLGKDQPGYKSAKYTCGLLEDLDRRIRKMFKDAKRDIVAVTGTVPKDMLAARGVYRRTRDAYAVGSYQVQGKKTEKNPSGLKTIKTDRSLATVYAEWLSAIGADTVTEKQAAKLAARLMEVANLGRVDKRAGSHAFKEMGIRGVAQDCVNGLLNYFYQGSFGYQLDDKGNPVKDENGQFIQTTYGGAWTLKKSTKGEAFCILTQNANGEEVEEECGGALRPANYQIVRKDA